MRGPLKDMKRRFNGMFGLLIGSHLLTILFTATVLTIAFSISIKTYYINSQEQKMIAQAREMADILAVSSHLPTEEVFTGILGISGRFIDGQVLLLTGKDLAEVRGGKGADVPFLTKSDAGRVLKGKAVSRVGSIRDLPVLFVVAPVVLSGRAEGAVLITSPLSGVAPTIRKVRSLAVAAGALAILLAVLLSISLSRSISKPLAQMGLAAREMAKGNFKAKVRVSGGGEISELGTALNQMSDELTRTVNILRLEKKRTLSILTSMSESVIAVDSRGRITVTNPSADDFIETLESNGRGMLENVMAEFNGVLTTGVPVSGEMDGIGDKAFHFWYTPIFDDLGLVTGAVGVFQDISVRRNLEMMQRQFVADVSHELRTPLTAIQGFSEAISDGIVDNDAEIRRLSDIMAEEARRLGRLVGDLLDLSRMETGYYRLDLSPLPLARTVEKVMTRFKAPGDRLELELDNGGLHGTDVVLADPDRVEQVLTNLITNAVQHSGAKEHIRVSLRDEGEFLACSVSDEGMGIPTDELPFIWDRFRRVRGIKSGTGTGLGLAIVKRIVEMHGGTVRVESEPSVGTTIGFTLPRVIKPIS